MLAVSIKNLSHKINNKPILNNVNFELKKDSIACVLGPSGSGKTTLLKLIHKRAIDRSVAISIYINDMFATGDDEANRETVAFYETETLPLVGLALREERRIVDKITKGTKLHS